MTSRDAAPGQPEPDDLDLSDEDILDAMRHIPGYLDISTEDFRTLYHQAHRRALDRLFAGITAGAVMRSGFVPLRPGMTLDVAARTITGQGEKGLPVVDQEGRVLGMLTENDYLTRLGAQSFLDLMIRLLDNGKTLSLRCHETRVEEAMTTPVIAIPKEARFPDIIAAFHRHSGRSMPVLDANGRLCGLLLKKDFLAACHLEHMP